MARQLIPRLDPPLEELPRVAVHTPTFEEFRELMEVYEVGGFLWHSGDLPTRRLELFGPSSSRSLCVGAGIILGLGATNYSFGRLDRIDFEKRGFSIYTPEQFYEKQEISQKDVRQINDYFEGLVEARR